MTQGIRRVIAGLMARVVSRICDAGEYPDTNEPETGVLANITAGNELTAQGATGLNGMSVLSVDTNNANTSTLTGIKNIKESAYYHPDMVDAS